MRKFCSSGLPHFFLQAAPMKHLLLIFALLAGLLAALAPVSALHAQVAWRMPITMTDIGTAFLNPSSTAYFGVHPNASNQLDQDTMRGFTDHWAEVLPFGYDYTP